MNYKEAIKQLHEIEAKYLNKKQTLFNSPDSKHTNIILHKVYIAYSDTGEVLDEKYIRSKHDKDFKDTQFEIRTKYTKEIVSAMDGSLKSFMSDLGL